MRSIILTLLVAKVYTVLCRNNIFKKKVTKKNQFTVSKINLIIFCVKSRDLMVSTKFFKLYRFFYSN